MPAALRRRLALVPLQLLGVALVVFMLLTATPGDPAENLARLRQPGSEPTPELVAAIRQDLGLDDPAPVRFGRWLLGAVRGDLGVSYKTGKPVTHDLLARFPATALLAASALLLSLAIALPLGIAAALRPGSWLDHAAGSLTLLALTVPGYVLALTGILIFAVTLRWLPAFGAGTAAHLVLPAVVLAAGASGQLFRVTRAALLEVLQQDYLRTARAKGLPPHTLVLRHALRNALTPVVTMCVTMAGHLLGGAVVVETVFGWPGLGKYAVDAVFLRDAPAVLGAVLYLTAAFVMLGALIDLAYGALDPRMRADKA